MVYSLIPGNNVESYSPPPIFSDGLSKACYKFLDSEYNIKNLLACCVFI